MSAFPAPDSHPTLLFYTYAPLSIYLGQLTTTITDKETLHSTLWQIFKPYISLLPNYSPSDPSCTPTAILATAWGEDELTGYGSYCNFQVGMKNADEDVLALRRGVPERGLFFAGEHASPFEECGTVAGAWLSGEGAARNVLKGFGIEVSATKEEGEEGEEEEKGVV
jgi:hypothetical protein